MLLKNRRQKAKKGKIKKNLNQKKKGLMVLLISHL